MKKTELTTPVKIEGVPQFAVIVYEGSEGSAKVKYFDQHAECITDEQLDDNLGLLEVVIRLGAKAVKVAQEELEIPLNRISY